MSRLSDQTRLIASATRKGSGRRPVNPPVERASTMLSDDPARMQDASDGPVYGLEGTSAARELKASLCDLEAGNQAFLVPSGLACVTVPLLALLRPGDQIVATDALYGPTRRFLDRYMAARGVTTFYHPPGASTNQIMSLMSDQSRVLLLESPASLTFEMTDVPALADICRRRGVTTIIDNTWAAGLAFKPLEYGVDVSVQALTKYVGGHSDLLMGSVVVRDQVIGRSIGNTMDDMGWHVSPDDAWLALRGLRTLPLRMSEQHRSAMMIAEWLQAQPQVARALYPPLPGSVGHDIWTRDYRGGAALIGLEMNGGTPEAAHALMKRLSLFGMGYSWGGFESLITHETPQLRQRRHPPTMSGELLRVHIGIETTSDLMADLDQALKVWP